MNFITIIYSNNIQIFSLPGSEWKNLRTKLTPAFTSGKLKGMFPIIANVASEFVKVCETTTETHEEVDVRQIAGRYVADCLASVAFGLDGVSTLNDPKHEFLLNGKEMSESSTFEGVIRRTALFLCPK